MRKNIFAELNAKVAIKSNQRTKNNQRYCMYRLSSTDLSLPLKKIGSRNGIVFK